MIAIFVEDIQIFAQNKKFLQHLIVRCFAFKMASPKNAHLPRTPTTYNESA